MAVLRYSTRVRFEAAPTRLWNEAIRVEHLDLLTPPWLRFDVRSPLPVTLEAGTRVDYLMRWHGLPFHWTTEVLECAPPHHFAYRQARGPYRRFFHRHQFLADPELPDTTTSAEEIELELFGGTLGRIL